VAVRKGSPEIELKRQRSSKAGKVDLKLRPKLVAALAFASAVAHAGSAFAVPSYSIANAPSDVQSGAVFSVDVLLDLDGNSSAGHEVSVSFTPGLLVATDAVELGAPPYEFNISPGVRGIDNAAGVVDQFEAAAFTAITPGAAFVVGQIAFQAGDVGEATIIGFFGDGQGLLDGNSQPIDGVVFNGASVNVIPEPTPTATPTPENECRCVPHRVVPRGNLAALKKASSRGNRSKQTKKVGVVLKAREQTRGACRPGSSTDTFSLRLQMVDDDGDVILDETRTGLTCDRRIRQQKFMASYEVENCAGSEAPDRSSKGEVTVTATTEDGELVARRTLKCNR
jgi:hypothetical protein